MRKEIHNCSSPVSLDELIAVQKGVKARFGGNEDQKKTWKDHTQASRSLELDVRIGHSYGVKAAAAPTHSAFIGAASSGSKLTYSDQQNQDMIYEDFDQVDQLEMEELDLKWQMAMLSLRINRECNVKTVDDKARYSAFKVTEVKTDEPKALVSVILLVNWSDHAAENKTGEVEKVYGMMAGLHADNGGAGVSDAAAEFAMMGISPKDPKFTGLSPSFSCSKNVDSLNAAASGNLLSKTTREALNIIENKLKVRYSRNRSNASRMNATSSKTDERIDKLADQLSTLVKIVSKKVVTPALVKAVEETCVTCGGAYSWYNCPATDNNRASVCATTGTYNQVNPPNRVSNQMAPPGFAPVQNNGQNRFNQNQGQGNNFNRGNNFHGNQASTSGTLPSNTIPNPKGEMKAITTRSGVAYEGPSIPTNPSPKKVVERETEETTDKEQTNFQGSTAQIPPPVIPISIPEPDVPKTLPKTTPIPESDVPKSLPKPNIPYPSRRDDQKSRDKASNQMEKIFQIFQDLRFDISFANALLLMPRFAPTIKSLLMNKEKLLELAKIPLNENCSAMLLKKLPEKLGDPGKFLIPCNFPGMDVCHALADLGASINLMPLSIWKKLSLPELTPTRMTLELADRSITYPKGLAEDVFVKVGKFHFPTDFVVVDFKADPRVPLILGRSFLRTGRALIDVYGEEITLRVDNKAVTFNLDQTTRYSSTNDKSVNRM
ncbi:reverse transcriptase domain-containing protein [Tanacetum coccineum]